MAVETQTSKSKEYIRPITAGWWFTHPSRAKFMVRELSSFFIAGYCIFLIVLMYRAEHADFDAFYESLRSPASVVLHLIALFFALFHSITFFNLTPRVLIVRRGEERVPDAAIAGAHFAAWGVVSVIVIVLVLVV
jgi:fumarate reductase subunit C